MGRANGGSWVGDQGPAEDWNEDEQALMTESLGEGLNMLVPFQYGV